MLRPAPVKHPSLEARVKAGLYFANLGVRGLDMRGEGCRVRPGAASGRKVRRLNNERNSNVTVVDRCKEVLRDLDDLEREMWDVQTAISGYRARVLAILRGRVDVEDPGETLNEVRAFLARDGAKE